MNEPLPGPTTARGSTYSYTYESHRDEPTEEIHTENYDSHELDPDFERTSTQTQKVRFLYRQKSLYNFGFARSASSL